MSLDSARYCIREKPPVVRLKNFCALKRRVDHYLYANRAEPSPKERLDLLMVCIATMDGARAEGVDVAELEGELDTSLNEIERRSS